MQIIDVPTENKPVSVVEIPNNLGVVIKANQLFGFEKIISDMISKENQ